MLLVIVAAPEAIAGVLPDCPHCDLEHGAYQESLLRLSVLHLGEHPLVVLLVVVSVERLGTSHTRGPAAGVSPDRHHSREFLSSDLRVRVAITYGFESLAGLIWFPEVKKCVFEHFRGQTEAGTLL